MSSQIRIEPPVGLFGIQALASVAQEDTLAWMALVIGLREGIIGARKLNPTDITALVERGRDMVGELLEMGIDPTKDEATAVQKHITDRLQSAKEDAAAGMMGADTKNPPVPSPS